MRKLLFILLSLMLVNICYSLELSKDNIDKIVYSHIGLQNKPVWATQISYYDLGSYYIPGTRTKNDVFYHGLRAFDTIMRVVQTYKINKECYDDLKKSIESYSDKVDSPDSLENRRQFGTMCVTIVEKGEITRWYFSRDNVISLFDIQTHILDDDTTAFKAGEQLKHLRNWFFHSDW